MRKPNLYSVIRTAVLSTGMAAIAATQAQPIITGITPDGSVLFQPSNTLAFVASAPAGVTNISVQLNGTKLTGATFLKVLSSASGLTITDAAGGAKNVSAPLSSNTVYSAIITATDANGVSTTSTVAFDTVIPAYTFEAEDFDFDGGQFIDNPQTNAYRGKIAVPDVDSIVSGGNNNYRPLGLATENCRDTKRVQYTSADATLIDYDVGWNDNGRWANYTRTFPTGKFNVYYRASNDGSAQNKMQMTWPDDGALYNFFVPVTGNNQVYTYGPLNDSEGVLAALDFNGVKTLRMQTVNGSYNGNFYMLVAASTPEVSDATVIDAYPDGAYQFQATNTLSFTISSTLGVNAADIAVQLAATNLSLKGTSTLLLPGGGLTVTGPATDLRVSIPLTSNMVYKALVSVSDANGIPMTTNILFDTITPAYTWEAEDWDYDSGQFIDNPQVNAYYGLSGVENVDFARPSAGGGSSYGRVGLAQEGADDIPRLSREGAPDYDIGNNGTGNWVNYTRNWPAGIYNVFIRVAKGSGGLTANSGSLSLVTSGVGTENQTTSQLGTYSSPGTGGWQIYGWRPLFDSGGNLVRLIGGSQKTLRHTVSGGNANQGFYMLIPADISVHTLPFVSDFKPDGSAMFQYTNVISFTANSAAGLSTNNVVVTLDGVKIPGLTFILSASGWNVSCPVSLNGYHTAVVTLTDSYGSTTNTTRFATFDPAATYIFEAEDYDYNGGQFIDNPQVNGYAGLDAIAEVDTHTVAGNWDGTHVPYRPSGLNHEPASDIFEIPEHAGIQNYNLGFTAAGNWGNYTRTYPAGTYNIYMRAANGNTTGSSSGGSMQQVTAGLGTANQTTVQLGNFANVPASGNWQAYTWVPLIDNSGNLAQFTGGSVKTLRAICGGGQNNDYYALVPVDASRPILSALYPNGASLFQQTNTLSFVAASTAGIDTNSITVTLNGVVLSNLVITGSSTSWNVSYPHLLPDTNYTASIAMIAKSGGVFSTSFRFDTFSPEYYTWEAEDYDYDNGKYIDNPQTNAYSGLISVDLVDAHNSNGGGTYRPVGTTAAPGALSTEVCGDIARAQYIGTGLTDYDVGYTDGGDWANYTRHFPQGTFNIFMRASNPNASGTDNAEISGPVSGRFGVPNTGGWQVYTYVPLVDTNGNRVVFASDGTAQKLLVSTVGGSYNANFFILVPVTSVTAPVLTASLRGGKIDISFGTQAGFSYQVQYKNSLRDASWTPLGSPVQGNGAVQSVNDSSAGSSRFYRVESLLHP